jgi:predicted  nucleic acid-binding Zn-ribbon protein
MAGVLAISWCAAIYWNYQMRASLKSLQLHHQIESLHYEEAKRTIEEANNYKMLLERHVQQMEEKKQGLEHELRVASELKEGETLGAAHNSISDVIERRQAVLQDKIESLRSYIQEESRREVHEK